MEKISMEFSRRDLSLVLPLLAAAKAGGQSHVLPSHLYRYEDLPVHGEGPNRGRPIFNGETHTGVLIELHETELAPGQMPHPPHHHLHEEMILVREGMMEVTIAGKSATMGPGSVGFVASGVEHGWKNVGTDRARYFVMAVGRDS
jgi:quercetin dioxygenase-like cupin family protein